MEITFKQQPRNRNICFLQKFKHKINRVDRISGLLGALGIPQTANNKDKTLPRKIKSQNNKQHPASDPQMAKKKLHESHILTQISVNRFKTESDDQNTNKENKESNYSQENVQMFSRLGKWKLCLDMGQQTNQQRQKEMKVLILPKIIKQSQYASQGGSRIKEKVQIKRKILTSNSYNQKTLNGMISNMILR